MNARVFAIWLLFGAALLSSGCVKPGTAPMRTVYFTPSEPGPDTALFIFLPGRWDEPESFFKEGFVAAVRRMGIRADMMAVDAHLGYYFDGSFPQRFREDVIIPAKEKGYGQIWLIGISLGGLGALWYDGRCPDEVTGVVALAPYLGDPDISRQVVQAGGLTEWDPGHVAGNDYQKQIWRGLKVFLDEEKTRYRVYLGYGLGDGFSFTNAVFSRVLPDDQVFTCQGGHDWATWRRLWEDVLDTLQATF